MDPFTLNFVRYLQESIFPNIVRGFAARGVTVTEEELVTMIQNNQTAVSNMGLNIIPHTGAVPPMAASVPPAKSKASSAIDTPMPNRCQYQFTKGANKHKYCGKQSAPGSNYCSACIRSNKGLAKDLAATGVPPNITSPSPFPAILGYGPPHPIEHTSNTVPSIPTISSGIPIIPTIPMSGSSTSSSSGFSGLNVPMIPPLPMVILNSQGSSVASGIPQLPVIKPLN